MKGVLAGKNLKTYGIPLIHRHPKASIALGDNVILTSLSEVNLAGVDHRVIIAAPTALSKITIGDNSGMSGGVIYAASEIAIGSNVNIGANTCIYDSDFHSLSYLERREGSVKNIPVKPIIIEDDVWIGARAVILKGVTIGKASIIGAGSIVTSSVPPNTVWVGNPARLVREIVE
jgi:acetyltransferase-like isoleucine patch superfamily enzyme